MAVFALLVHPTRQEAAASARELAARLVAQGHEVVVPDSTPVPAALSDHVASTAEIQARADLGISLGGDGSILRAIHLLADGGTPVLGVNYGSLGYLAQAEPGDADTAIEEWLAGAHEIEERMRVAVRLPDGSVDAALNEIVVEKIDSGRTIRVGVRIAGHTFHTYEADGVIVASPTGSTAYSLSARGPLVDPTHEALVFTPVAPHTLFDRSLVLTPTTTVEMTVEGDRAAAVAVDGRTIAELAPGDTVTCAAAAEPARLLAVGNRNFHQIIKSKFKLNDR